MEKEKVLLNNKPGLIKVLFGLNQEASKWTRWSLTTFYAISFILLWQYTFPYIFPRIQNVYSEFMNLLFNGGMLYELGMSLKLAAIGMFFSLIVAFAISFGGAVTNVIKPIAKVLPYFRLWSTLGFAPIMRVWVGSGGAFQVSLLMFGIIPFLVTSFNSVLRDVDKDPLYDYARTMGYPEWRCAYYVVYRSKLAEIYIQIRNNYAIAWVMMPYVEIANRDSGGIGAMIYDATRFVPSADPFASSFALNLVWLSCGILIDYLFRRLVLTLKEERIRNRKNGGK